MSKQFSPSAQRNKDEILSALRQVFPSQGTILEIAAGTGLHAVHWAPHFPRTRWQPTDRDPEALASIRAYVAEAGIPHLCDPLELDVTWPEWPVAEADAIVCSNMLHISPWAAAVGLVAGAARTLRPGAPLLYYGALIREGVETAPSNLAFDRSLRERNSAWGVRRLEEVAAAAEQHGLTLEQVIEMPNNNVSVVFRRPG